MFNPFLSRQPENKWVVPVSLMALVVGLMTSIAWIGNDNRFMRLSSLPRDLRDRYVEGSLDLATEIEKERADIKTLREENTRLQNAVAQNSSASAALNKSLQDLKLYAALTPVEGPGVIVTLKDSHPKGTDVGVTIGQIIHDTDVVQVVNELKNTGAEAISVNNLRVGPLTNFRCVGTTILVDETKVASPIVIRAIGEADVLFGGMSLPGGILDQIRMTDPKMVEIQVADSLMLPAFSGTTTFKYAKLSEDKSK